MKQAGRRLTLALICTILLGSVPIRALLGFAGPIGAAVAVARLVGVAGTVTEVLVCVDQAISLYALCTESRMRVFPSEVPDVAGISIPLRFSLHQSSDDAVTDIASTFTGTIACKNQLTLEQERQVWRDVNACHGQQVRLLEQRRQEIREQRDTMPPELLIEQYASLPIPSVAIERSVGHGPEADSAISHVPEVGHAPAVVEVRVQFSTAHEAHSPIPSEVAQVPDMPVDREELAGYLQARDQRTAAMERHQRHTHIQQASRAQSQRTIDHMHAGNRAKAVRVMQGAGRSHAYQQSHMRQPYSYFASTSLEASAQQPYVNQQRIDPRIACLTDQPRAQTVAHAPVPSTRQEQASVLQRSVVHDQVARCAESYGIALPTQHACHADVAHFSLVKATTRVLIDCNSADPTRRLAARIFLSELPKICSCSCGKGIAKAALILQERYFDTQGFLVDISYDEQLAEVVKRALKDCPYLGWGGAKDFTELHAWVRTEGLDPGDSFSAARRRPGLFERTGLWWRYDVTSSTSWGTRSYSSVNSGKNRQLYELALLCKQGDFERARRLATTTIDKAIVADCRTFFCNRYGILKQYEQSASWQRLSAAEKCTVASDPIAQSRMNAQLIAEAHAEQVPPEQSLPENVSLASPDNQPSDNLPVPAAPSPAPVPPDKEPDRDRDRESKRRYKNVEELIENSQKLERTKNAKQRRMKGDAKEIFNELAEEYGVEVKAEGAAKKFAVGSIRVTLYESSSGAGPTIQINLDGSIFKIRMSK